MTIKGLRCDIYTTRLYAGCGSIARVRTQVTLIDPAITPPGVTLHEPTDAAPAVRVNIHRGLHDEPILTVVPVEHPGDANGPMFSGSFIYSSDERFAALMVAHGHAERAPVAFHDHYERSTGGPVVYPFRTA